MLLSDSPKLDKLASRIHNSLAAGDLVGLERALGDTMEVVRVSLDLHQHLDSYVRDRRFFQ